MSSSALARAIDKAARSETLTFDVNVSGEEVYPAAVELRSRGIPFIFLSGYGSRGLREEWKGSPMLEKPFAPEILEARINAIMQHA